MTQFLEPEGDPIEPERLSLPRARAFMVALADHSNDYARLVECRTTAVSELVVFEVDVELGQIRTHPIQHRERLVAVFRDDDTTPEVLALREDFPSVPHLNLRLHELPRSLCLYDERFRDLKKTWTAPRFIERIREWLALTAKGNLHQDDQPLEPLFLAAHHIVLPDDLFDDDQKLSQRLAIEPITYPSGKIVCILKKAPPQLSAQAKPSARRPKESSARIRRHRLPLRPAKPHSAAKPQPKAWLDIAPQNRLGLEIPHQFPRSNYEVLFAAFWLTRLWRVAWL